MTLTESVARSVVETYGRAWMSQDPDLILTIFTPDATYRENVFLPPFTGHSQIRHYWKRKVVGIESDIVWKLLTLFVDPVKNTAIAEWDARFLSRQEGRGKEVGTTVGVPRPKHIQQVAIMRFEEGKIAEFREYWFSEHLLEASSTALSQGHSGRFSERIFTYQCPDTTCRQVFESVMALERHRSTAAHGAVHCLTCSLPFTTKAQWKKHVTESGHSAFAGTLIKSSTCRMAKKFQPRLAGKLSEGGVIQTLSRVLTSPLDQKPLCLALSALSQEFKALTGRAFVDVVKEKLVEFLDKHSAIFIIQNRESSDPVVTLTEAGVVIDETIASESDSDHTTAAAVSTITATAQGKSSKKKQRKSNNNQGQQMGRKRRMKVINTDLPKMSKKVATGPTEGVGFINKEKGKEKKNGDGDGDGDGDGELRL